MSRKEFEDRLPRIVAFSELEPYLKARLGELSSGLAARLPFATAVHSDLDILLVDEMLSVGDREFQAKCRETFLAFKSQGKTLMIASHDHAMIQALCPTTLYLRAGMPVFLGDTTEALRRCAHDSPKDRPPP